MPTRGKASALAPSPAYSTNARCRRGRDRADGNAPPFGGCCITRLTQATPSMAKPSFVHGGESHAACVSVACVAVQFVSGTASSRVDRNPCTGFGQRSNLRSGARAIRKNKRFSPRRTLEPSLLQGLLVCQRCGYGLYRASTRTSQRTIYYYRCLGRDGYRHLKGAVCDNQPIRQEQLDAVVWQEIVRLLEDPSLLQAELDRRLQAAQTTDPLKRREDALRRDQARLTKSMERLLTGYQENLITLEELRCRMPELRKQQRANEAELQSLEMTAVDPTRNLRLV